MMEVTRPIMMISVRTRTGKSWIPTCGTGLISVLLLLLIMLRSCTSLLCHQCDSDEDGGKCITDPSPPDNCTFCVTEYTGEGGCRQELQYNYCVRVMTYDANGTLLAVSRSCLPFGEKKYCTHATDKKRGGIPVEICTSSCDTDGCNSASRTASNLILTLLVTLYQARHSFPNAVAP